MTATDTPNNSVVTVSPGVENGDWWAGMGQSVQDGHYSIKVEYLLTLLK